MQKSQCNIKIYIIIIAALMAIIFLMPSDIVNASEPDVYINVEFIDDEVFGDLRISGYFFSESSVDGAAVNNHIVNSMKDFNDKLTTKYQETKPDSEQSYIYKFNNNIETVGEMVESGGKRYYPLDIHAYTMLKSAQDVFFDQTLGFFDPTVYPLVLLWGLDAARINDSSISLAVPSKAEIDNCMQYVGVKDKVFLLEQSGKYYAAKSHPSVMVDLGAQAKGYAADLIKEYLDTVDGIVGSFYSLSGNAYFYGVVPLDASGNVISKNNIKMVSSKNFVVSIATPDRYAFEEFVKFEIVSPISPVTSGTYQRYKTLNGVDYCHIINPKTGFPVNLNVTLDGQGNIQSIENVFEKAVRSVTIFDVSSEIADVYATAALLMGLDSAIEWLDERGRESVIICEDNTYANLSGYSALKNDDGTSIGTWANPYYGYTAYLDYGFGEANYQPPKDTLSALKIVLIVLIIFGAVIMLYIGITEVLKKKRAGASESVTQSNNIPEAETEKSIDRQANETDLKN